MTDAERRAALEAIAAEIRGCTRCRLHEGRSNAVPGEGNASTEVMFVGEGPGFNEDRQGRPFVGRAGEKLTQWIESIGWRRQDVFITNIVKCRPPDNRDPMPDEIAACTPFLRRQLAALDPAVVVTLGRFSMGWFTPGTRISQVHGTARLADEATGVPGATAYAMYHPAAALRAPEVDRQAADDMFGVPLALISARERRAAAPVVEPPGTPTGTPPAEAPQLDQAPAAEQPADETAADEPSLEAPVVSTEAPRARPATDEGIAASAAAVQAPSVDAWEPASSGGREELAFAEPAPPDVAAALVEPAAVEPAAPVESLAPVEPTAPVEPPSAVEPAAPVEPAAAPVVHSAAPSLVPPAPPDSVHPVTEGPPSPAAPSDLFTRGPRADETPTDQLTLF